MIVSLGVIQAVTVSGQAALFGRAALFLAEQQGSIRNENFYYVPDRNFRRPTYS